MLPTAKDIKAISGYRLNNKILFHLNEDISFNLTLEEVCLNIEIGRIYVYWDRTPKNLPPPTYIGYHLCFKTDKNILATGGTYILKENL